MGNKVVDKTYLKRQLKNFYDNILLCKFPKINDQGSSSTTTYSSTKIESLLSAKATCADLSQVAFSGCYSDLTGIPPSADSAIYDQCGNVIDHTYVSCLDSGIDQVTGNYYNQLKTADGTCIGNITSVEYAHCSSMAAFDDAGHCINSYYVPASSLSTVATSGAYADLSGKPNCIECASCDNCGNVIASTYGSTLATCLENGDYIVKMLAEDGTGLGYASTIQHAIDASCACTDVLGNRIDTTYATKTELATHTATFRGSFATWAAVPEVASGYCCNYAGMCAPSANDYMVVQEAMGYSSACVGQFRFKYTSEDWEDGCNCKSHWVPEYRVNEDLDTTPTQGSGNGITSGAVYTGLSAKLDCVDIPTCVACAGTLTNVLPVNLGGTGQSTEINAANALLNCLDSGTSIPVDKTYVITGYAGTQNGCYYKRPVCLVWDYIKTKLCNVAYTGDYGDLTGTPTIPTDNNQLDNSCGFTTCKGTVTVTNRASNATAVPVALCTGSTAVGRSTACALTYVTSTGTLATNIFSATTAMVHPVGTASTTNGAIWITT